MKRRILPFLALAGICSVILCSYSTGPAAGGENRCGVLGSPTTCGQAGGCHSTAKGTVVSITVDSGSANTSVSQYVPGQAYTIKIHGTSTSNNKFFGFQFASASGTGTSQVQAGLASGFPRNVKIHQLLGSSSNVSFIEHDSQLVATTAGVYDVSFQWTAPTTGAGNITLYCSLNAVNGDNLEDSADISGNTSVVLSQAISTSAIYPVFDQIHIAAYPNPATGNLSLQFENTAIGTYSLHVFNLMGMTVVSQRIEINGAGKSVNFNTGDWAPGLYSIVLENGGGSKTISVVKE